MNFSSVMFELQQFAVMLKAMSTSKKGPYEQNFTRYYRDLYQCSI